MKKILLTLLFIPWQTACRESFLDLQPLSNANVKSFYNSEADMIAAINGAYAGLQATGVYREIFWVAEVRSDNTEQDAGGTGLSLPLEQIDRFDLDATNSVVANTWRDHYVVIARSNAILDRIDRVTMREERKKQVGGEARFLRALMYFNLVRLFGDVPLATKEFTNTEDAYGLGRTPAEQVYTQIINDLKEAETALPVRHTANNDIGRVTSGAAKTLLGKVYLTRKQYTEAAVKLKEVIDSRTYELLPAYRDVFAVSNGNHKESVFEVQFKAGGIGQGLNWANNFAPRGIPTSIIATGGGLGFNKPTADIERAFETGDLRKEISMATGYTGSNGSFVAAPYVRKWIPSTPITVAGDTDNNFMVLRYADVLLMYAEVLNETGKSAEALTYLNQIRQRAGLAALTELAQPALRLAIEKERRVELAFENHRWFDLLRTGRAVEVMRAAFPQFEGRVGKQLLYPIPQTQIDINPTVIKQNPGY
ncbi:RagB/SusD family nutrient uptake outer membrane protein [Nibrella saemangeumensis]|uniref:RagB/SusD family nutrient uptake outer membrane protein n=1 Tax=Nibrella saemangeumensis TaxID=1084526 RepID=A0ABP8MZD3_9BACT